MVASIGGGQILVYVFGAILLVGVFALAVKHAISYQVPSAPVPKLHNNKKDTIELVPTPVLTMGIYYNLEYVFI